MVEKMCTLYGEKIEGTSYHAFPDIKTLVERKIEEDLKIAKFGYRAKFIQQTVEKIFKLGSYDWIEKLKKMDYNSAKRELMLLPGVGPKVKTIMIVNIVLLLQPIYLLFITFLGCRLHLFNVA